MSVMFARADIPPEPPPSKGCAVDGTGGMSLVVLAIVVVGLYLLRGIRGRAAQGR